MTIIGLNFRSLRWGSSLPVSIRGNFSMHGSKKPKNHTPREGVPQDFFPPKILKPYQIRTLGHSLLGEK